MTWTKDGKELNIDGKKIRRLRFKLVVRRVQKKDAGLYSCTVQVHNTTIKGEGSLMIKGKYCLVFVIFDYFLFEPPTTYIKNKI